MRYARTVVYTTDKCQSLYNPTATVASALKAIQSHSPAVITNSPTSKVVRLLNPIRPVSDTARTTSHLTRLEDGRDLFRLLRLVRIAQGRPGLALRHSDKLTTCLFMINNQPSVLQNSRPLKSGDRCQKSLQHLVCRSSAGRYINQDRRGRRETSVTLCSISQKLETTFANPRRSEFLKCKKPRSPLLTIAKNHKHDWRGFR
jgi:hypothetical protein